MRSHQNKATERLMPGLWKGKPITMKKKSSTKLIASVYIFIPL